MTWDSTAFEGGRKRRGRFPLLPDDPYIGWTPYAWLIYLPIFFIQPVLRTWYGTATAGYWAAMLVGVAIFLYTYFRVHWVGGRDLLLLIGIQLALGVLYAPFNVGSSVFIVYAACFAGQVQNPRTAWRLLLVIPIISALTSWAIGAPMLFWLSSVVMAPLFGAVLMHFAQAQRAGRQLIRAQEEIEHLAAVAERERIARDLHDVLGHTLSLVVLKAELAGKLIARDADRARAEIRDVEQTARQALQDVRETIRGYRATVPGEIEHAQAILAAAGIRCDVAAAPIGVGRAAEETLALALREAATNVVRHSRATSCRIAVAADDRVCTLEVEDDGRGTDATEGSGLLGMRERVAAAGGSVEREAGADGGGTLLRVTLPVHGIGRPPVEGGARAANPAGGGTAPGTPAALRVTR